MSPIDKCVKISDVSRPRATQSHKSHSRGNTSPTLWHRFAGLEGQDPMATKRSRSPSLTDDAPPAKRNELQQLNDAESTLPHTLPIAAETTVPIAETVASTVEQGGILPETTDAMGAASDLSTAPPSLMVVAPDFQVVHDSWEAFEEALKAYAKVTYQLYVIRSTTSVKRRNLKIAESATKGDAATGNGGALRKAGLEMGVSMEHDVDVGEQLVERTLIPERYQWYSKSLKCTHGWKDRHRGTGKRGSGVVRSTSCPAKMCVTLQHRGAGPDDWKVVVTKHVRTHNHQLSKELFLYYSENRRIYDPELLTVVGDATNGATKPSVDLVTAHLTSLIDQASQRTGVFRVLASSEKQSQQQTSSMAFMVSDALAAAPNGNMPDNRTNKQLTALTGASCNNFVIRPRVKAATPLASMPPLGAVVLTPGTIPSRALDGGGFCVPRIAVKVHPTWDAFHDYLSQYAFDTAQVFRTRSTVSVASRNAKILATAAAKAGADDHDVASYASYAATLPPSRLIPDEYKWFSKLLICTYGWKRRARGKAHHVGEHGEGGPCPAMLLARVERNVEGQWHIVINRQVPEHNHRLNTQFEEPCNQDLLAENADTAATLTTASPLESASTEPSPNGDSSSLLDTEAMTMETSVEEVPTASPAQREIVVRVPKLQSMFNSWDDFHANLKAYSDATYQLYRTRTTSSAKGRNKKIAQMKPGDGDGENSDNGSDPDTTLSGVTAARKIPESWRWYSKTLTCTHGWKERHRGTGSSVISVACRVHGSSSGTSSTDNGAGHFSSTTQSGSQGADSANGQAAQCTCFRIAGGGNYVTIVPATDPLPATDHSFDADDSMFYAEDMEGAWQPSSKVEIEKVTTESGEMIWRVPRIVRRYPTWEAFHKYLDAYSAATFQLYRVRTTYSVRSRNLRLRQLAASRGLAVREGDDESPNAPVETEQEGVHGLSRAHVVPEEYEWYSKTFLCTHGWKRRSRGSGQRVCHNVRATECPAKVCATLQRTDGANSWSVVVTKHLVEHNHELSEVLYQQYSEVRRVRDPEVLAQAEQLWRGGASRRRVFKFLKERSPNHIILMKDVHNLVQRWQAQERRPRQSQQGEEDQDQDQDQGEPSQNPPPVVSASHDDESSSWL
ncbi:hypothetical protein PF010_g811 [Phytophthora fragariae]|uniref:FAR1 domain-containing protein n=1 Tax=Phytophthora fragariae TaxID=53985 RepID=A0A6G0M2H2_9STRA|nr:hypothetical protein PF010_g811 [Phytophthora fragariae]